jgi:hypothetical protein
MKVTLYHLFELPTVYELFICTSNVSIYRLTQMAKRVYERLFWKSNIAENDERYVILFSGLIAVIELGCRHSRALIVNIYKHIM